MTDAPETLSGGNVSTTVVRWGDEVERDAGPWTPAVQGVLRHLEARGVAAPRARGFSRSRERVTYVPGDVVHPDRWHLLRTESALADVFASIRGLHDALADLVPPPDAPWRTLASDPAGPTEMLCHNDLGPWNLVSSGAEGWVFIDWDLLAPGRRDWELAWAVITLVPLNPEFGLSPTEVGGRLRAALTGYGVPEPEWRSLMDVVLERVRHAERVIRDGAARGEEPWLTLEASGHAQIWADASRHAQTHHDTWLAVAQRGPGTA